MVRIAPYAAAASAALVIWHVLRPAAPAGPVDPAALSTSLPPQASPAAGLNAPPPAFPATGPAGLTAPPAVDAAALSTNLAAPATLTAPASPKPPTSVDVVVGRNDTLEGIFKRLALDPADLAAIRQLPGVRQSLDVLKPGDAIELTRSDASLMELTRTVSETKTLHVVRGASGFAATLTENPVQTRVRTATATIDSSLFQAAQSADISDGVALKLAGVFAWDIDFVLDIRAGDRFTAVYQQVYRDGKYLRDGELLAAEFVNAGKKYRAVRYVDERGSVGYYTPDGKPMRKAFLRAPVEFTRVSSVFNPHRLHPILNLIRGHIGTDYAAPIGTPGHAAGDGRVSFEGVRGGYGNAVVLAHSNNVSTLYGHMSRFARNVRIGSHVLQGEVIGYVGMTGLATGPHLHYEYLMNGVHKDPQSVKLPGAEPLRPEAMAKFHAETAGWLQELAAPPQTAHQALPSTGTSTAATSVAATSAAGIPIAGTSQYLGEPRLSVD